MVWRWLWQWHGHSIRLGLVRRREQGFWLEVCFCFGSSSSSQAKCKKYITTRPRIGHLGILNHKYLSPFDCETRRSFKAFRKRAKTVLRPSHADACLASRGEGSCASVTKTL